jgi:hypothetical protein
MTEREALREYRRVAVFGGVYSNTHALAATLDDARARGVEAVFCLGDVGGFGPHPDRAVALLRERGVITIQGNYDAAVAGGAPDCGCGYTDPRDNHFARLSYAYTLAHTSTEHRRWLGALPSSLSLRLGPLTALLCHGSPRAVSEFLWESTTPDGMLGAMLDEARADVLLCTHSGIKWHRQLGASRATLGARRACRHAVNVGVIGRPENDGRTNVWYTVLTVTDGGLGVEFVPVTYDHEALGREMDAEGLPPEFVETVRTGWWTTCLEVLPAKERARGRF